MRFVHLWLENILGVDNTPFHGDHGVIYEPMSNM